MKKNVLIFPCGSEIALEINRALSHSIHVRMFGASSVSSNHGKFVFENYIEDVPFINDPNFIDSINEIIDQNEIDFIYPAHDSVVVFMAQHQAKINAKVITSPYESCRICRSKGETYKYFKGIVNVPLEFSIDNPDLKFPLFLKPDVGQGSKGTQKVNTRAELDFYYNQQSDLLILEYLPGPEYTIDCFSDHTGELKFVGARVRNRISNGISVETFPVEQLRFIEIAETINSKLSLNGAWFFQVKERSNGELVLMEIAPRIAGGMGLYRNQGVNIPLLSLFNQLKFPIEIINQKFEIRLDRSLFNRYELGVEYQHVYIDLDDTIIIDNKVNSLAIAFIYQCMNKGKQIHLISKHRGDIYDSLRKFKIDHLFNTVIWLKSEDRKCDHITRFPAIFIDDAFSERKQVSYELKIPVFEVSAIESLLEWRN
ncbi:ATP-grasp domain-containing protein [Cohnella thailandensis]|uniref:ATP-grasp domain-containing protein n=1 Tax=Cohnella thailandensis TaxID=557557 RepID=A0A841SKZ2_9BACL|nr:ATP-grasp domain-containing protein [Cohnella thailandensis]MBB6632574.1 ATP-grasp domain-containing protein [Cohnella thailandensis]MBP1971868.1 hypothetical protein [Cohnella thailandensis]